jgi:hypothetical protein
VTFRELDNGDKFHEKLTCLYDSVVIEAKKGDSYHVKIDDIIAVKDERLEVKVFVDGVLADVQYACPSKRDVGCNIKCKGFRIKGKDGHSVFQAFTFGDIPVTGMYLDFFN